ncbi:MAG: Crp/Fnr family transcriptional regulator, partial [Anaerolineales bacterium]
RVKEIRFNSGDLIFGQGDPADRLFLLVSGKVEIQFHPPDDGPLTVTVIEADGVFGWSAMLGRKMYTSSAICVQAGQAFWISGDALRGLCEQYPQTGVMIVERLAEVIAGRLSSTREVVAGLLHNGVSNGSAHKRG